MAILTKPSVSKGTAATFTLNKTELSNLPTFTPGSYFSDIQNWKVIKLCYISQNKQREVVVFDATQQNPVAQFLVSEKANDIFQIRKIIIQDFDGGYHEIAREGLVVEDFDVLIS